jgi:hypothetical protein
VSVAEEPSSAKARQQLVTEQTLRLVEKQIGHGQPPSAEEWQRLRGLAGDDAAALQLVDELQAVVQRFDEQLRRKFGDGETNVDLARLRQGLAHLIREIVRRKAAVETTPPHDAN